MTKKLDRTVIKTYDNPVVPVITGVEVLGMLPCKYFNCFTVDVSFMQGDSDGWCNQLVVIKEVDDMLGFVNFLMRYLAAYPKGKHGQATYEYIEGYEKYVGDDHGINDKYLNWWPVDAMSGDICHSLESFEVLYYGSNGQPFDVKLIAEE